MKRVPRFFENAGYKREKRLVTAISFSQKAFQAMVTKLQEFPTNNPGYLVFDEKHLSIEKFYLYLRSSENADFAERR
jgi:superfamily II DNA or RNA helicase